MQTLSKNAFEVLKARYLLQDNFGNTIETPDELFRRTAKAAAGAELKNGSDAAYWEEEFYELLSGLYFLPNSPALMNAGTTLNQLSACFVLPVNEGIDNIFKTLKETVIIQKSNGGTGFNFSNLSHEGVQTFNEKQESLGALQTIEIFNAVVEKLKSRSKRAGANMGVLNINHPDIEAFIELKKDESKLQNFNLSVGITDKFMNAVANNLNWELVKPNSNKVVKTIKAGYLWQLITSNAWQSGDPGLLFLDEIERKNPIPSLGKLQCTNPCGEVPLLPYEACNLGSINLSKIINTNTVKEKYIDWEMLGAIVKKAVRFLDNIISTSNYLIPEIEKTVYANRKIGLGVMGWAEMLLLLEIPYQSEQAILLAENLMKFISAKAHRASQLLAIEKGAFPNFEKSIYNKKQALRNATCTSIAPTGSIAIIAGTTASIEPLFALAFTRKGVLGNKTLSEINPVLLQQLEKHKLSSTTILDEIMETGKLPAHKSIKSSLKKLFLTAPQINALTHIRHQQAFQKHTDNAVSKTINLPKNATEQEVAHAFKYAWETKLKGITIFRQGCKSQYTIHSGIEKDNNNTCGSVDCCD